MTQDEKKELLQGIFQNANLSHAQINVVVESGAKVVYQEVKTVNGEKTRITDEQMVKALERIKTYFWAQSSWAVVFCVWRDRLDMGDNMTAFEKYISTLQLPQDFPYACPSGTVQRTISNNTFMKMPIDKWNDNNGNERCIILAKNLMAVFEEV